MGTLQTQLWCRHEAAVLVVGNTTVMSWNELGMLWPKTKVLNVGGDHWT